MELFSIRIQRTFQLVSTITSIISPPTGRWNTPVTARKRGLLSATNPLPSLSASRTNSWRRQWNAATHNENNPTMAIRTNTNPRQMDLRPEMRNMLMRNGLQAHIAIDGSGYRLIVQGHD